MTGGILRCREPSNSLGWITWTLSNWTVKGVKLLSHEIILAEDPKFLERVGQITIETHATKAWINTTEQLYYFALIFPLVRDSNHLWIPRSWFSCTQFIELSFPSVGRGRFSNGLVERIRLQHEARALPVSTGTPWLGLCMWTGSQTYVVKQLPRFLVCTRASPGYDELEQWKRRRNVPARDLNTTITVGRG